MSNYGSRVGELDGLRLQACNGVYKHQIIGA